MYEYTLSLPDSKLIVCLVLLNNKKTLIISCDNYVNVLINTFYLIKKGARLVNFLK